MSLADAKQRNIPTQFLKPILPSPRYLAKVKIIESDANGMPDVQPQLVLLDCSLPPEQLADEYPALYEYILVGERKGLHRRYLLSRRSPWYRQEQRLVAPILCSYMGRKKDDGTSISFYRNNSQAITTNVYLMLHPKPWIMGNVRQSELFFDGVFQRLLELDQQEVVYQGRTYGGGLDKIEPTELQRVVLGTVEELEESIPLLRNWKSFKKETNLAQHPLPFAS